METSPLIYNLEFIEASPEMYAFVITAFGMVATPVKVGESILDFNARDASTMDFVEYKSKEASTIDLVEYNAKDASIFDFLE
jgi:hypothetical protein